MADDTRQSNTSPKEDLSKEALTVHPENKSFSGSQWNDSKATTYAPPENANMMAGGTQHTAGGKVPEVTLMNALTTGRSLTEIHKAPCVRDSFLQGIIGGFAIGGGRFVLGAPIFKACNWVAGSFALVSAVSYQYCLYQRQAQKEGMVRAMEIMSKKQAEKQAREERKAKIREERREAKERELDAQYKTAGGSGEKSKSWFFW